MRAQILIIAVAIAAPGVTRADDRQAARDEFSAGEAADARKDWRTAIAHYLRAYELSPHPNALYNVAVDHERLGEVRESATFYRRYLDEGADSDDRERVVRLVDNLQRRRSKLAIRTSPPGGLISIDGARVGQAPVTRELAGGTYAIAATLGDRRDQRSVTLEYGEPAEVVIELTAQAGTLSVTSNVRGATVEIDGIPAGTTPLSISVAAGNRKVVVSSAGFSTLERVVRVPGEGSAQITATLVRPLGHVAPVDPDARSYLVTAAIAQVLEADTTMIHLGYGYHLAGWEGAVRVGFLGDKTYSYGILVRRLIGTATVRPFVGGWAEYGASGSSDSTATVSGHLGANGGISIKVAATARMKIDVVVDVGVGTFAYADGERRFGVPISASLQFRPGVVAAR